MFLGVKSTFSHKHGASETSAFRSLSPLPSNYSSTFPLFLQVPPTVPRASVGQTSQHRDQLLHWLKTQDSMRGARQIDPSGLGWAHPHCWPKRWGTVVTGTRDHLGLGHMARGGEWGGGLWFPGSRFSPPPHNTVIRATQCQAVNGI